MKAIVVRDKGTGAVVAMGPDNGMYDPGYDQATMVKDVESDYAAVYAEWRQANPVQVDRRLALLANPAVPQWFKDFI